jgi:mannose-1-phosphate guanylyltransferase/mannose-6-phosphate isomerase
VRQRLIPAVMSGGSGTRLWPLSTDHTPKQFHALGSKQTLIQESVQRLVATDAFEPADPILICNHRHASVVEAQMREVGRNPAAVVLEPFGRNTAAVAAIAGLLARNLDPDALVLLMPADHVIIDRAGFSDTIAKALPVAQTHVVVFGVDPTAPETGYGYIEGGETIAGQVRKVVRFAEKPNLQTAEEYLAGGRHLWNAGIFLFSPTVMLAEMERLCPEVLEASRQSLDKGRRAGVEISLDTEAFAACPSISIDYAVMEQTDRAAVAPIGVDWADVGSWSELWRLGPLDGNANFMRGDAIQIETEGTLIWAQSKTVGVIGMKDVIVVQTDDAVIVLPKSRAQDVKMLVEQIKARKKP